MQFATGQRNSQFTPDERAALSHRWLRVGFFSFAYRLAHLCVSRPVTILGVSAVFYLV